MKIYSYIVKPVRTGCFRSFRCNILKRRNDGWRSTAGGDNIQDLPLLCPATAATRYTQRSLCAPCALSCSIFYLHCQPLFKRGEIAFPPGLLNTADILRLDIPTFLLLLLFYILALLSYIYNQICNIVN